MDRIVDKIAVSGVPSLVLVVARYMEPALQVWLILIED